MYIPSFVVQSLHEDRIRDAQHTAQNRVVTSEKSTVNLFSRISQLLHVRSQQDTRDARHAHAI